MSVLNDEELSRLQEITEKHLETIVLEARPAEKVVIGMPTIFLQTFANVFAYYYLSERLSDKDLTFVFGGASISYPQTITTFEKLKIDAYAIIGEGEKKLLRFVQKILANDNNLTDHDDGVFHVLSAPELFEWKKSWFNSQIKSIKELPLPDFKEYFDYVSGVFVKDPANLPLVKNFELPLEGSRGCVFTCEFCNLNRFWMGYRKLPGEEIAERVKKLFELYPSRRIRFVDNLCDGWAEQYADILISENLKVHSFMELRPKHKNVFWKKLAESGLKVGQLGTEGLDSKILGRVGKGTNVTDVIHATKALTENDIILSANIITFYPNSTIEETKNTDRHLKALLHMPKFNLNRFWLGIDSPLYTKLMEDQKKDMKPSSRAARSIPAKYENMNVFFYFESPEDIGPTPDATIEWRKIRDWYEEISPTYWLKHFLIVESDEQNGVVVFDRRFTDEVITHKLDRDTGIILEALHEGKSFEQLLVGSGLNKEVVTALLNELLKKELVLQIDQSFIGLPLRITRSELKRRAEKKGVRIPEFTKAPALLSV
ncbi:MAG: B12-binding domain-containing radical SAM protein [Bacteriovoracaceae bacterium]